MELPKELQGKAVIDVATAAKVLGISTDLVYDAVATGDLPSIRFGRKILIPVPKLLKKLGIEENE